MIKRASTIEHCTDNDEVIEFFVKDVKLLQEQMRETSKELVSMGLTPNDYAQAYKYYKRWEHDPLVHKVDTKVGKWLSRLSLSFPYRSERNDFLDEYRKPISNAAYKTLRLLIRERSEYRNHDKDIITREVEVPANYTFKQLHDVIDAVFGIKKQCKWKFGRMHKNIVRTFDDCIALPIEVSPYGSMHWNYNAEKTEISGHLSLHGCWYEIEGQLSHSSCMSEIEENRNVESAIISVTEIIERPCQHPRLINWKGEYNMPYLFQHDLFRTAKKFIKTCKLPRREAFKGRLAAELGYDNWHDLDELLDMERFKPEEVQSFLNDMPGSEQMEAILTKLRSAPKEWYEGKEDEPFVDDTIHEEAVLSKALKCGLSTSEYSDFYRYMKNYDKGSHVKAQDAMVGKWLCTANLKYPSKMMDGYGKVYDLTSTAME